MARLILEEDEENVSCVIIILQSLSLFVVDCFETALEAEGRNASCASRTFLIFLDLLSQVHAVQRIQLLMQSQ